jgi:hypothetical protein
VPTHEELPSFLRDFKKLTPAQRRAFRQALTLFVESLRSGRMADGLRVKPMKGVPLRVWEMSWAPDGRATFTYGEARQPGDPHVVWRRIGSHSIFREP